MYGKPLASKMKLRPDKNIPKENEEDQLKLPTERRVSKAPSHFLIAPDMLEKITRRVVAPYAQIERRGTVEKEKEMKYMDINRFNIFLEDEVDLNSLLFETAAVLKSVTKSSGVLVYTVNELKGQLILMPYYIKNPERHTVTINICEGKSIAAHVAATKEFVIVDNVPLDTRFTEGVKWCEAETAMCIPVVQPDGKCYAVLEFRRTFAEAYNEADLYAATSCTAWAGAAVHQTQERITLQRKSHLNEALLYLIQQYFCDSVSLETMISEMLSIVKKCTSAMRSSFYVINKDYIQGKLVADLWEDGWDLDHPTMQKKKTKVDLESEQSVAGLVARSGQPHNVRDVYKDPRFTSEVDPISGIVWRSVMAYPIKDKYGVIGVVQVVNKSGGFTFTAQDEEIFKVFVKYCTLIIHFAKMQHSSEYLLNLIKVHDDLAAMHLHACRHDLEELKESCFMVLPLDKFKTYEFHISDVSKDESLSLLQYMFTNVLGEGNFDRNLMCDFLLTVMQCYRPNPYHNSEHAFVFTHTMYLILTNNMDSFDYAERTALMLAGLCHDLDHPGVNNNFLSLCKHPLSEMYHTSTLENHHFYMAKKLIEDKKILNRLPEEFKDRILEEVRYNILSTDLAVYFQVRAQLTPLVAEELLDWDNGKHKALIKGLVMTSCDLSGMCKPFPIAKAITEAVYEEFYSQGDRERSMGYVPLSMMDRKRSLNQPAEQIQFLAVVVIPCLLLLQSIFPNTNKLADNCWETQNSWHDEIELRGLKLWKQEESLVTSNKFKPDKTDVAD